MSETLCWKCRHAVPKRSRRTGRYIQGCDWSIYRCRVPGWKAKEDIIIMGSSRSPKTVTSFEVQECPKFERG